MVNVAVSSISSEWHPGSTHCPSCGPEVHATSRLQAGPVGWAIAPKGWACRPAVSPSQGQVSASTGPDWPLAGPPVLPPLSPPWPARILAASPEWQSDPIRSDRDSNPGL